MNKKKNIVYYAVSILALFILILILLYSIKKNIPVQMLGFLIFFIIFYLLMQLFIILFKKDNKNKIIIISMISILLIASIGNIFIYLKYAPVAWEYTRMIKKTLFSNSYTLDAPEYSRMTKGKTTRNSIYNNTIFGRIMRLYTHRNIIISYFEKNFFKNKYIIVDEIAYSKNGFIYDLINMHSKELWESKNLHSISEYINEIIINNNIEPQTIHLYDRIENERNVYIYTGKLWLSDNIIYIVEKDDRNIYMFPNSIIEDRYIFEKDISERNEIKSFYVNSIFAEFFKIDEFIYNVHIMIYKEKFKIIFMQILFLIMLFSMGIMLLMPYEQYLENGLYPSLALTIGAIYFVLYNYLIGLIKIKLNIFTSLICPIIFLILYLIINDKIFRKQKINISIKNIIKQSNLFIIVILILIFCLICIFPNYHLSPDSFANIEIGIEIFLTGEFTKLLYDYSSNSIIGSLFQMGARMLGLEFNYSYILSIGISGYITIIISLYNLIKNNNIKVNSYLILICSIIFIIPIITEPSVLINSKWILNNYLMGIILGISLMLLVLYFTTKNRIYILISLFAFILFGIARIEAPTYALLFLIAFKNNFKNKKDHIFYSVVFSIVCIIQYIFYIIYIGNNTDQIFWTPLKGGVIILFLILFNIYLFIPKRSILIYLDKYLSIIICSMLIIINILLYFYKHEHVWENIKNLTWHLFVGGNHGSIFILLIGLAPLSLNIKDENNKNICISITLYIFMYIMTVLALMAFRNDPIHEGVSDSSNRMLLHIEFIIPVIFTLIFTSLLKNNEQIEI